MSHRSVEFKLKSGSTVIVDAEDYELLSKFNWYVTPKGYVVATITMHRIVVNAPHGAEVDHVNGDTLDNRKANLRPCTRSQNVANTRKPKKQGGCSSTFKGVCWDKRVKKWSARVQTGGRSYRKYFGTEEEAALAYDEMAREHFGEFARLNFPQRS